MGNKNTSRIVRTARNNNYDEERAVNENEELNKNEELNENEEINEDEELNEDEDKDNVVLSENVRVIKSDDFYRRVCVRFIPIPGENICSGCREPYENGIHQYYDENGQWDCNDCTEKIKTNGVGDFKFPGSYNKSAKYIVVDPETSVVDMADYLYNANGFNIIKPKMILSITGGAQNFTIDKETKNAFKLGLMKAAKTTNAWIISGGTNTGVMRLVGDAVAEDFNAQNLTVLGIASYGCIAFKDEMISPNANPVPYFPQKKLPEEKKKLVPLNPNHSCFILVDNGSAFKFGVEIDFRTKLESHIVEDLKIPMVLIVVEGGVGTLNTVLGALDHKIPIILVANTKGCADIIRVSRRETKGRAENQWPQRIGKVFEGLEVKYNDSTIQKVMEILRNPDYDKFINVFEMNTEGCGSDIEQSILNALSKAKATIAQKVELAILWNRIKIAIDALADSKREKLSEEEFHNLLELALLENKYEFVNLLLENEVDLRKFLNIERLEKLYNNEASQKKAKYEEPFLQYLQKKKNKTNISIDLINIKKLNKELFPGNTFKFLPQGKFFKNLDSNLEINDPEMNLFYWSVLSNRIEIAKIFWRLGKYQIPNALIASRLLGFFSKHLPDFEVNLKNSSKEFEDLAIGTLIVYDKNTRENVNDVLVIRYLKHLEMDSLELAVHCKCKNFVSNTTVQTILDNIWVGHRNDPADETPTETALKLCQAQYNDHDNYVFKTSRVHGLDTKATKWEKFISFLYIPNWHFKLNLIFYILFLLLFSYTMLFKYKYDYEESVTSEESFSDQNITNGTLSRNKLTKIISKLKISGYEVILLIWIFSLIAEELRQFVSASRHSSSAWIDNIKKYFQEQWNILDVFGCILFILGFIVKSISLIHPERSEKIFNAARVLLSIDIVIWYMRSLHFCLVLPSLGPKLLMIRKMFNDLKYFLIIIATFVLAFGVSLQSIIYPGDEFSPKIFIEILNIGYWPIYGEISILSAINNDTCLESGSTEPPCLDTFSHTASYILLMVYMLLASVLLINLLIAVFSSTYEEIQQESDTIWKNQRYSLICEYADSPILPPPLNLFVYIFYFTGFIRECINPTNETKKNNTIENDIIIDFEQKSAQEYLQQIRIREFEEKSKRETAGLEEKVQNLERKLEEMMEILYADREKVITPK